MNNIKEFELQRKESISSYSKNEELKSLSSKWMKKAFDNRYMYNFECLGRPIIQTPVDMVAMQEIIWEVKPDLIIETGIAHGGSLILSASMLALLDVCEASVSGLVYDSKKIKRKVLGIDIDIRPHNRKAIEAHPLAPYIQMLEGSSVDLGIVSQVTQIAKSFSRVLVCLDSNHTHNHVLAELNSYASMVSMNSYCIVFDTIVEDLPVGMFPDRPWAPGDNPKTAVWEFLKDHPEFQIDRNIQDKLLLTVAPDGYLRRTS